MTRTTPDERTHVVEMEIDAATRAVLQAEADARGVSLEDYVRWRLLTTATAVNAASEAAAASLREEAQETGDTPIRLVS